MRRSRVLRFLAMLSLGAIALAAVGGFVMLLWNWLLPSLTGWSTITFPKALGLLLLCRLLFGGLRGRRGGRGHFLRERFERMTPEERERFREAFRMRCRGGVRAQSAS